MENGGKMENPGEIYQLCRLCLANNQVNVPIFGEKSDIRQISLKISSCLPVVIAVDDLLPKNICEGCSDKLELFYAFWNSSQEADKTLRAWMEEININNASETISAVVKKIANSEEIPLIAEVKEETEDFAGDGQNKTIFNQQPFDDDEDVDEKESEEAPPSKRARLSPTVEENISINQESDDDDNEEYDVDEVEPKVEDESDMSDSEDDEPLSSIADRTGTSVDEPQAGPSGVGKDGAEAPILSVLLNKRPDANDNYRGRPHHLKKTRRAPKAFCKNGEPPHDQEIDILTTLKVELNEDLPDYDWLRHPLAKADPSTIQDKTKVKYERTYIDFIEWLMGSKYDTICEDALIDYFSRKAKVAKASTLWAVYSMLKSTMLEKDNIDINDFRKLHKMLREKGKGYVANKAKVFSKEQVQQFLREAPDEEYLMYKVALIIGISGGCRRDELAMLTVDEIQDLGAALLIKVPDPKSNLYRTFTVIPEHPEELDCTDIIRKYHSLRPDNVKHNRFFVAYSKGVCSSSVVGMNSMAKIPTLVARFLNLLEPEKFNAHSFRNTRAYLKKTDKFF